METHNITSNSDPNDPRPWVDFDVFDGEFSATIREVKNYLPKGSQIDVTPTSPPVSDDPDDVTYVLAITLDGDIELVGESRQRPVYHAHLAWYNTTSQTWVRLLFVEPVPVMDEPQAEEVVE